MLESENSNVTKYLKVIFLVNQREVYVKNVFVIKIFFTNEFLRMNVEKQRVRNSRKVDFVAEVRHAYMNFLFCNRYFH